MAERKRIRGVAACLMLTSLVLPARPAQAVPVPAASTGPAQAGPAEQPGPPAPSAGPSLGIAPRAGLPGLRPDPDLHPSTAPGGAAAEHGHGVPGRSGAAQPSREERDALLARLAPYGVRPVLDEAGAPALTADRELVLAGGPEALAAMQAAGVELAPGPRAGVSAVRSGERIVGWYVLDDPVAPAPPSAPPNVPPVPSGVPGPVPAQPPAAPVLPKTGPSGTFPLAASGAVLLAAGAVFVRIAARRRARG
ncbi:LPXTG cell wall anchor domain-containing protein [Yinghuangia soli]|uniref:LPXTG cell wall anchor domain-containing protein n=1 Tax=Yinghuangia soli TaxID=2908204 RepID=A0AA41TX35_9ACTN|nr:LPXTG cell wall anchor domain-containing protein [Yinghuangia soli]MCF2526438.1 LPXTG cell wall anchor domain-containing protein [Yinghuangia soli]